MAQTDRYTLSESCSLLAATLCKTRRSAPLVILEDALRACAALGCAARPIIFSRSNLRVVDEQKPRYRSFGRRSFLDHLCRLQCGIRWRYRRYTLDLYIAAPAATSLRLAKYCCRLWRWRCTISTRCLHALVIGAAADAPVSRSSRLLEATARLSYGRSKF